MTTQPTPEASLVAWVALTIDCQDADAQERLRDFYAGALGGEVVEGAVRARGWLLIFDVVADYRPPTWPSSATPKQVHFEWVVWSSGGGETRVAAVSSRARTSSSSVATCGRVLT